MIGQRPLQATPYVATSSKSITSLRLAVCLYESLRRTQRGNPGLRRVVKYLLCVTKRVTGTAVSEIGISSICQLFETTFVIKIRFQAERLLVIARLLRCPRSFWQNQQILPHFTRRSPPAPDVSAEWAPSKTDSTPISWDCVLAAVVEG